MFFEFLDEIADWIWTYPAILLILIVGLYFSFKTGFFQIRQFHNIVHNFAKLVGRKQENELGVHPVRAFFASVGGAIGMGNVVVITVAIQIGGPGALFWTWVTGLLGMMLKYAEVYLGMKTRIKNPHGSYDGGPMYYLQKAFKFKWIASLAAILLCIYGVEVYMFSQISDTIAQNWEINRYLVALILLGLVIYAGAGGVARVGKLCSAIVPFFVVVYVGMAVWVLLANAAAIPGVFATVFSSAFTGHAAVGGFTGATIMMAMGQGVARGCYSGDIGIGYASVIHAESSTTQAHKQACLAVFGIFLDTFIVCSASVILILVTGVWNLPIDSAQLVQTALAKYFPLMDIFMPLFLLLLAYSTVTAYLVVGTKCARFLSPKYGQQAYLLYAILAFALFSFVDPTHALTVMTLAGGLLLLFNTSGIFLLRKEINFHVK